MTVLRTERLVLRPITEDDLDLLIDLDRDPDVVRYASPEFIDSPPSEATHRPWLEDILAGYAKGHRWWAAEEAGDFVGWFFLREGEFGYRLKRSAWGRGLATEGGRAVLATTAEPIHADAVADNAGSLRVLEKLGFVQTGEAQWRGMRDLHFELRALHTERLVLRPLSPRDLDDLVALDSDPEVLRHTGAFATEVTPAAYAGVLCEMRETPTHWAAEEDGGFVGWFYLRDGELGYRLKRSAWGRGLATEGARAVLARAEGPVHAQTRAGNAASRRVLEKLGLRPVGERDGEVRYER